MDRADEPLIDILTAEEDSGVLASAVSARRVASSRAAEDWLDGISVEELERGHRNDKTSDEDLDAQAEQFLQSMNRDAILQALRRARDEG